MGNTSSNSKADNGDQLDQKIVEALESNQIELFKELVNQNVSSKEHMRIKAGQSYPYLATIYGHPEALEWLINTFDCNPNGADDTGKTLLHFAANEGCLETLTYLIDKAKSKVEAIDSEGFSPFLYAVYGGQLPCVKYIAARMNQKVVPVQALKDGRTSIHLCAQEGHVAVLKWLVDNYPSTQTERIEKIEGMTPFHLAARFGHATVLDFLLRHCSVDPNVLDTNGKNALHHATRNGYIDAVKYLVEQVCLDPYAVDHSGRSSIEYAAMSSSREVSKFLSQFETSRDLI